MLLNLDTATKFPYLVTFLYIPPAVSPRRGSDVSTDEERGRDGSVNDTAPTPKVSLDTTNASLYFTPSAATPPGRNSNPDSPSSHSNKSHFGASRPGSAGSRNGNRPPLRKPGSPLRAMHKRLRSEADLSGVIAASTYNRNTPFLYKDLGKALGPSGKAFMMERKFWNVLFMSVVTVERSYLGWNENTAELYQRCVCVCVARMCVYSRTFQRCSVCMLLCVRSLSYNTTHRGRCYGI